MKNLFLRYFDTRIENTGGIKPCQSPNIITISRQPGCNAQLVAQLLQKKFAQHGQWQIISRQIIEQAAEELQMNSKKLASVITSKQRTIFAEIIDSLSSKQFKSDKKIKQTVFEMIETFMQQNNTIVVGRGGIHICCEKANALHVRLTAPLNWRVEQLQQRLHFTRDQAFKFIEEQQVKRDNFISSMQELSKNSKCFDVTINCASFSLEEIAKAIESLFYSKIHAEKITV